MLIEVAKSFPNVAVVLPTEKLCRNDACELSLDSEFLYLDQGHIRRNLRLQTKKDFADKIGLTAALSGSSQGVAMPPGLTGSEAR